MSAKRHLQLTVASSLAMAAMATPALAEDKGIDLRDLTDGDPFFYTSDQYLPADDGQADLIGEGRPSMTHSRIPHLPVYFGYMNTNYTYRFINVMEQVFTMVGEGKHGLWRVQEAGMVREYLKPDAEGLPEDADLFAEENLRKIEENYTHFIPEVGFDGYHFPDQQLNDDGELNFIDLPVNHPKYGDEYADMAPIDLPNYFCTMSGPGFPYAKQAMNFAFQQPGANELGPLGERAGLGVQENYTNVLRLDTFPDARTWVNVGVEGEDEYHVNWQAVDESRTQAEYYMVERPFFNVPYLFLVAVYDNQDNDDFSYVRPDGPYFDFLQERGDSVTTELTMQPGFHLENGEIKPGIGLPLYGVHHPDRDAWGQGGACPEKGGDWGRYPETSGGSGWASQYQEVTPQCDAVLVDIKFFTNLDGQTWNDPDKYLANAGFGTREHTYKVRPGDYGEFTDPYLVERGIENPERRVIPEELTLIYPTAQDPVDYVATEDVRTPDGEMHPIGTSCRPVQH